MLCLGITCQANVLGTGRYNYVCPTHLRSSSYVLLRLHECALAFSFSGGMRLSLPDPREQDTLPAALFLSQLARWTYSMHLESDTLHGGNRRLFERSACVMLRCGIVQPSARSVLRGCPPESRKRQSDRAKPSRALAGCKTMGCGESVVWHERVCSVCPSADSGLLLSISVSVRRRRCIHRACACVSARGVASARRHFVVVVLVPYSGFGLFSPDWFCCRRRASVLLCAQHTLGG